MDERKMLEGVLRDIRRMRTEMKVSKQEADDLEIEVETMRVNGTVTELSYAIYRERLRRSREDISFMLRKLDREHKSALRKLIELDEDS